VNIKFISILVFSVVVYLILNNPSLSESEGDCEIFSFGYTDIDIEIIEIQNESNALYVRYLVFYTNSDHEFFRLPLDNNHDYDPDFFFEKSTLVERCSDGIDVWLRPLSVTKT
jgi:hypothetical protein